MLGLNKMDYPAISSVWKIIQDESLKFQHSYELIFHEGRESFSEKPVVIDLLSMHEWFQGKQSF